MSWKPTHLFDGVECLLVSFVNEADKRAGLVPVLWSGDSPVANRIPLVLWERHAKPIIEVGTATLPWVSVRDVPHPADGTTVFLARLADDCVVSTYQAERWFYVTHWCRIPEAIS
jgi:hypothetical protein